MTFEPRITLARDLAKEFTIHAMADLSDGLARDLRNICIASNAGASLTLKAIPIHDDVHKTPAEKLPHVCAITDGEDYELLIISPDELPAPCVAIGHIQESKTFSLETDNADVTLPWDQIVGWEHQF